MTPAPLSWSELRPGPDGLVPCVAQDADSGAVLMLAYLSAESLAATARTGRLTFYSRSRKTLWEKGATSGHTLDVLSLHADCDGDAVLALVRPRGPACHTGAATCFTPAPGAPADPGTAPVPWFDRVEQVVWARRAGRGLTQAQGRSYVRDLLAGGARAIGAKLREEADELARAVADEAPARVASEAADVVFHMVVALCHRDLRLHDVARVLARRFGVSGIDEKAART